jgi:LmbE family N-acetylglucosaminyl deacetylase
VLDTHPNHRSVAEAALAAYRHAGRVWGKEEQAAGNEEPGWNLYFYEAQTFTNWDFMESLCFRPNVYVDIEKVRELKKRALEAFKSQASYNMWEVEDNIHVQRGKECGVPHAEAFILLEAKPGCPLLPVPTIEKP